MKYRNELILCLCLFAGAIVSSIPTGIVDYAERASMQALVASGSEYGQGIFRK